MEQFSVAKLLDPPLQSGNTGECQGILKSKVKPGKDESVGI